MMGSLRSALRIPPVVDACVAAVLLLLTGGLWSFFGKPGQLGYVMSIGLLISAIWVSLSTGRYLLSRRAQRAERTTALRERLEQAYRSLLESMGQGGRFAKEDSALALPWFVLVGPSKCGKSLALKQAGFTPLLDISGAGRPEELAGELWLSPIYGSTDAVRTHGRRAVIWEIAGNALYDNAQGDEILRWLAERQQKLAGIVFMVAADQLAASEDDDAVRNLSRKLSRGLLKVSQTFLGSLPLYILLSRCDRIDGFRTLFGSSWADEQRTWGFASEPRPTLTELQGCFAKLLAILEPNVVAELTEPHTPREREELLEFPREFQRISDLTSYFIEELLRQVGTVQLHETFLCSAQDGEQEQAPQSLRRRKLPVTLPSDGSPGSNQSYFLDGAFERLTLRAEGNTPALRRQWITLACCAVLTLIGTGLLAYVTQSRWLLLDEVQDHLTASTLPEASRSAAEEQRRRQMLDTRIDRVDKQDLEMIAPSNSKSEERIGTFLRAVSDAEVATGLVQKRLSELRWDERQSANLTESVTRYLHCRTARALISPMLAFNRADAKHPSPLYSALAPLLDPSVDSRTMRPQAGHSPADSPWGGGQPGATPRLDRTVLWQGFDALKAIALISPDRQCTRPEGHSEWIAKYFADLWLPQSAPDHGSLENRLKTFFAAYLRPTDARHYPKLGLATDYLGESPLGEIRTRYARRTSDGNPRDITLTLMGLEAISKERKVSFLNDPQQPLYSETSLPYELTEAGCRDIENHYRRPAGGDKNPQRLQLAWLDCALGISPPAEPLKDIDLRAYYSAEMLKEWSRWMSKLKARRVSTPAEAEQALNALPGNLRYLLLHLGTGGGALKNGEREATASGEFCRSVLEPFSPFRKTLLSATEGADEPAPPQAATYAVYLTKLRELQGALTNLNNLLAGTAKDPAALPGVIAKLNEVAEARRPFIQALKQSLGDGLMDVEGLNKALAELEDAFWDVALKSLRQVVTNEWMVLRSGLKAQPAAAADGAAPAGGDIGGRAQVVEKLVQFQRSYLDPFFKDQTNCIPKLYGNGEPWKRQALCQAVCNRFKGVLDLVNKWRPQIASAPPGIGIPAIIAGGGSACAGNRIAKVRLDTGELAQRFVCEVWLNGECKPVAESQPPAEHKASLELSWRKAENVFDSPLSASRERFSDLVLALLPRPDAWGRRVIPTQPAARGGEMRAVLKVPIDSCPKDNWLEITLNKAYVQHLLNRQQGPSVAPWATGEGLTTLDNCVDLRPERAQ